MTENNVIKLKAISRRITLAAVVYPKEETGGTRPPKARAIVMPAAIELRLDGRPALVLDRAEAALAYAALGEALDALDAATAARAWDDAP